MLVVLALRLSNASLSLLRPLRRVGWATTHDNIRFRAAFAAVMAPRLVLRICRIASGRDGCGSGCAAIQASRMAS